MGYGGTPDFDLVRIRAGAGQVARDAGSGSFIAEKVNATGDGV